jgi:hypothetical protein
MNRQRAPVLQHEGRRSTRVDLVFMAQLRESGAGAGRFAVTIKDMSVQGFRFETSFGLQADTRVWLTIPGLAPLEAEIMWKDGLSYGGKFAAALHVAVLDHITKQKRR